MTKALTSILLISAFCVSAGAQDGYQHANCDQPSGSALLEVGNVSGYVFNDGSLFWSRGRVFPTYRVPSSGSIGPIFSASFLAAGFIDDDIRVSGSSYGPYELWPGPVPEGNVAQWTCDAWDRFWHLDYDEDFPLEDSPPSPTPAVLNWPVHLGAEFIDRNGLPGYQPEEGDLPFMNGDRQVWWIMNDRGNEHIRFGTAPMGIEVRATAFGFDSGSDLGNQSFYRYRITNLGDKGIRDMTVGLYTDFDLGFFNDDRAGTDTTRALWYVYNADNDDEADRSGYGEAPPAAGFAVLEASHSEGILPTDLGHPASRNLGAARMFTSGGGVAGDPGNAPYLHNMMIGRWQDDSLQREGTEIGWGGNGNPTPFYMPGDPVTGAFWSELNVDGNGTEKVPSDRWGIFSTPVFDLAPGEWAQFTFALVWARGTDHHDSITRLREITDGLHDQASDLLAPRPPKPPRFIDGNPPDAPEYPFWVDEPYPNPADNRLTLRSSFDRSGLVSIRIIDALGRSRIAESLTLSEAGQRDITLDVSALSPGSYSVTVESWSHRSSQPFVVVR